CSILPKENIAQIQQFLADTPDASLSPIVKTETVDKPGRQITPGEQQMDGFYYARLVKSVD
ncbi:MAG TPA: 16S rRNA (cytosine(967)-C(5))-methyltransferase, partial [Alteromonas macleodii]|nr:16S rRNA (cytosine(967)-C(5))-methyltransferase [Alteromonas macleodii]